jgi:peroxiredoxin
MRVARTSEERSGPFGPKLSRETGGNELKRRSGRGLRAIEGAALMGLMGLLPFLVGAAPPTPGSSAPDFQLKDLQGNTVRLSTLRGKTVVLHFWATWCPHCLAEMPLLENANRDLAARGAQVLAINLGEPHKRVERYTQVHHLKLTILLDSRGKAAQAFGVVGLPATLVIDPEGRIAGQIEMGSLNRDSLEKLISPNAGNGE